MTVYVNGQSPTNPNLQSCVYEVWGREQKLISTPERVCYQPQGGAVVCINADDYQLSSSQPDNFQGGQVVNADYIVRVTATTGGQTGIWQFTWPYGGYFKGKITNLSKNSYFDNQGRPYSRVKIVDTNGSREIYENGLGGFYSGSFHYWQAHTNYQFEVLRVDGTSLLEDIVQGNSQYKIEIFKEGQKVHEYTSNNPISAWLEPATEECQWTDWRFLRDLPVDEGTSWYFNIRFKEFYIPFPQKCSIFFIQLIQRVPFPGPYPEGSGYIADLCSDRQCSYPEFDLRCKTFKPPRPKPECNKKCPEGYYLDKKDCLCKRNPCPPDYYRDDDTGICKPMCEKILCRENEYWDEKECKCKPKKKPKCPKCPESAKYQCQSDGYLCCYDECYNLIAQIPIPKDCI